MMIEFAFKLLKIAMREKQKIGLDDLYRMLIPN